MMGSRRRGWRRRVALCGDFGILGFGECVLAGSLACLFLSLVMSVGFLHGHIYTQDIRLVFVLLLTTSRPQISQSDHIESTNCLLYGRMTGQNAQ